MNTTKALLITLILLIATITIAGIWILTPQHSGVAYATLILGTPVIGVLVACVIGDPQPV